MRLVSMLLRRACFCSSVAPGRTSGFGPGPCHSSSDLQHQTILHALMVMRRTTECTICWVPTCSAACTALLGHSKNEG